MNRRLLLIGVIFVLLFGAVYFVYDAFFKTQRVNINYAEGLNIDTRLYLIEDYDDHLSVQDNIGEDNPINEFDSSASVNLREGFYALLSDGKFDFQGV